MGKILLILIVIVSSLDLVKCQNSITGCYSSNFAIIGWFATHIKFSDDNSFEYLFAGDLFYDKIKGTYEIVENQIILSYDKKIDSLEMADFLDSLVIFKFLEPDNNAANHRPSKLRIKENKLF